MKRNVKKARVLLKAMYNYPLTLLLRSRMTLLPLDFDHFTPNLDNFTPIQKGYLAPKLFYGVLN